MDVLTLEEAQQRICSQVNPLPGESVDVLAAVGRVAATDHVACRALPSFTNAAMDGYAVRAADVQKTPTEMPVVATVAAGDATPHALRPHEAMRIYTGACLPEGANAVVMQEDTRRHGNTVVLHQAVQPNQHVRHQGDDMRIGDVVLPQGLCIGPGEIGALAAQGMAFVQVVGRPRVAIVPTGDELVEIHTPLTAGKIVNSNSFMLAAQVQAAGGVPWRCPIVPDTPEALSEALHQAARVADLILTVGGVSVGELDWVRHVLQQHGSINFWKVAIKPGKPLCLGQINGTPLIGLPGNPVSSFVCFELFARPAVRKMQGLRQLTRPQQEAQVSQDITSGSRRHLMRGTLSRRNNSLWVTPLAKQGSGQQSSILAVNALIDVPENTGVHACGSRLSVLTLNEG